MCYLLEKCNSLALALGASRDFGDVMDKAAFQRLAKIDGPNDSMKNLFIIGASKKDWVLKDMIEKFKLHGML